MDTKKWRHFICGLLFGAGGVYGQALYGEASLNAALDWLQREADVYRAEHPELEADSGWGPKKKH